MWKRINHYGKFLDKSAPDTTLCIPAYNAAPFIQETIEAVKNQTYQNFRCVISVDLSDDTTYDKVNSCLGDGRFSIYRQQLRLGWAGNVNFVLRKATTKYVCLVPHDDLIHPTYLESLLPIIKKDQRIAAVFSDIVQFGNGKQSIITQSSITGPKIDRVLDYLNHHYNAVVFRGIINRAMVGDDIYCSTNEFDDFSEDTIWGLKLALHGQLVRHPEVLYRKRYLKTSYHYKWQQWDAPRKINAWTYHCAKCWQIVKKEPDLIQYQEEIASAIMNRTLQDKKDLWRRSELQEYLNEEVMTAKLFSRVIGSHE